MNSQRPTPTADPATAATDHTVNAAVPYVLNLAGRLIAARGLCRGDYTNHTGALDMVGAIQMATFGKVGDWAKQDTDVDRTYVAAHDAARAYLDQQFETCLPLSDFSDLCVLDAGHAAELLTAAAVHALKSVTL